MWLQVLSTSNVNLRMASYILFFSPTTMIFALVREESRNKKVNCFRFKPRFLFMEHPEKVFEYHNN